MLVFDEAQFILPVNVSRNTEPARLNWIRRSIIDARIPAAFSSTRQSYKTNQQRLVRATGYAMEQFEERMLRVVALPDEIGREDLLSIARKHFEGLPDNYLEYVVAIAHATERCYVSDVAKIARLAGVYAREAGRERLNLSDIKGAIQNVLPMLATPGATNPEPVQALRKASARGLLPACDEPVRSETLRAFREQLDVPSLEEIETLSSCAAASL